MVATSRRRSAQRIVLADRLAWAGGAGPLGDATQGSPGGSAMYTGSSANALTTRFAKSQDTLYALAGDTGGRRCWTTTTGQGIVDAQHAESDYYILGYYTSNTTKDGKFRKVKVTVNSELSANLDFRQGYFGEKEWGKFNTADKERQLEDALMQGDPWTDLTIATEVNYFQLNKAEYFVPVMMKVPGREIALAKKGGADHTHLDLVGEIKDDYGGTTVANIRDHFDANWGIRRRRSGPNVRLSSLRDTPCCRQVHHQGACADDETGRIGTFQTTFVIPNLNKETKQVPISSVVLSSERKSYSEPSITLRRRRTK